MIKSGYSEMYLKQKAKLKLENEQAKLDHAGPGQPILRIRPLTEKELQESQISLKRFLMKL